MQPVIRIIQIGYVNLRLRRDSIGVHLLHLNRKDSLVKDSDTECEQNLNISGSDISVDTSPSINFVSELVTSANKKEPDLSREVDNNFKNFSNVKYILPENQGQTIVTESHEQIDYHLLHLRESATKGKHWVFIAQTISKVMFK